MPSPGSNALIGMFSGIGRPYVQCNGVPSDALKTMTKRVAAIVRTMVRDPIDYTNTCRAMVRNYIHADRNVTTVLIGGLHVCREMVGDEDGSIGELIEWLMFILQQLPHPLPNE